MLTLASQHFDVFVTVDRNLAYQQNFAEYSIAVAVLCARSNPLAELIPLVPTLLKAIEETKPGVPRLVGDRP
ncbi:MAG: hypothetical protein K2Z80_35520 [Xanthobacteraceae bacterium]|nr:hypothetical protein [Xanthobacteraceae bacterium]